MTSKLNFAVLTIVLSCCINDCVGSEMHPASGRSRRIRINPALKVDWNTQAQDMINEILQRRHNTNVAKNVILFLGDGMGVSTVTAGRVYAGQLKGLDGESYELSFDKFPHVALSKTYNIDFMTPDSAGTATAYLCGEKTNLGVIGVNQNVVESDCNAMSEANNIDSILRWSINAGKRTGVVTTTRITHATPAASYAHSPDRDWEHDAAVPIGHRNNSLCEDIASQLVTKNSDINVIFGGGRARFMPNTERDYENTTRYGSRADGRNLIEEWKQNMVTLGKSHAFVWNKTEFDNINPETTDHILGLFERDHMQYDLERADDIAGEPSLVEMTTLAINNLKRSEKGFFLLVEGGRIDHGHHANRAKAALHDLAMFEQAVQVAVNMTSEEDTLIVVTADHSHVFTMGGYPSRNHPILEFVDALEEDIAEDGYPHLTVMYANGPGGRRGRTNLTGEDPTHDRFVSPAHVPFRSETHGGEDVAIYARGPMSHLFNGVQEQHYIAHVMAYASCVGSNTKHCETSSANSSSYLEYNFAFYLVSIFVSLLLLVI